MQFVVVFALMLEIVFVIVRIVHYMQFVHQAVIDKIFDVICNNFTCGMSFEI